MVIPEYDAGEVDDRGFIEEKKYYYAMIEDIRGSGPSPETVRSIQPINT